MARDAMMARAVLIVIALGLGVMLQLWCSAPTVSASLGLLTFKEKYIVTSTTDATTTSPSPSGTVWSEGAYTPKLAITDNEYVYETVWGTYSFPKLFPHVCQYESADNVEMVSFSSFWIKTSTVLIPLNPVVMESTDNRFVVKVDAYKLIQKMATVTQTWDFNRPDRPKISVTMNKTAQWGLGDFNIVWVVGGFSHVKDFENEIKVTRSVDGVLAKLRDDVMVEMGPSKSVKNWRNWLIVDWSDEGVAEVYYGMANIYGVDVPGVTVIFNLNDSQIDPSIVDTSTTYSAVSYPFQRKTFYAAGRYWVFYSDGSNMVYRVSVDGTTWSSAYTVAYANYGYRFSVHFDGTYVHYARYFNYEIYYRRGTPNADNTIIWSAAEQKAVSYLSATTYYFRNTNIQDNLWNFTTTSGTENLLTEVITGANGIDNWFYINPFTTKDNVPDNTGTSPPTQILIKGWRTPAVTIASDRTFLTYVKLQNRAAVAHAGRLYFRIWKSVNADMSNAVLAKDWQYLDYSFSAILAENKYASVSFYLDNCPDNEYLYVEFAWRITTAAASVDAGFKFSAVSTSSYFRAPMLAEAGSYYTTSYFSSIAVSDNEVFIGYLWDDGISYRPRITKATVTDGTWTTSSGFPYELSSMSSTYEWKVTPIGLTSGKAYVVYAYNNVAGYGKLWDGLSWGPKENVMSDIEAAYSHSAVAQGDNVFIVFNHDTQASGIRFNKRTYGVGWGTENSIQTNTLTDTSPSLTIDPSTGDLYCVWYDTPAVDNIYYKKYTASTGWDSSPTQFYNETEGFYSTYGHFLSTSYQVQNCKVGITWCSKTASPYNVKFDTLTVLFPEKPVLISPDNNTSISDPTPTFTWTAGAGADNHRIEVDDDPDFSSPIDNVVRPIPDNSWTKPAPGYADGTYYWRVWAINSLGENVSENTWQFVLVGQPPGRPVLVSPEDNAPTPNTPTFTWTDGADADNHRIEVDDDPDFSSPIDNVVRPITDNSWTKSAPGYATGIYYWRVWAINPRGENVSENTWQFTIGLLKFKEKYVVTSTTAANTTSATLVDDPQASQTFTLDARKVVLVIYQANNVYGASMYPDGMQNAINIDGTDYANSWDSPYVSNYTARNCTFWIGTLASGSHTIKGRFASNSAGSTVTVSNRVLLIYIFEGGEFRYIDDATASNTTSATLVDDPNASVTFTPPASCKALILYNISNSTGTTESGSGKKAAINVAGTDYSQAEKSPNDINEADSVFTVHAMSLSAVSTIVKGRFASNSAGSTVTISRRQLGVLLLADSTLLDIVTSDIEVSTTSSSLVDDNQATISKTTNDNRELLVVAMGTKRYGVSSSSVGECYGISVNGVDRANSRGSSYGYTYANSAATAWAENLTAGSHTVKGRFSTNTGTNTAKISSRRVVALWFYILPPGKPTLVSPENGTSTSDNTPTFTWQVGSDADNHRILVDNDGDLLSPVDNVLLGATDNTWTKPDLGYADEVYYWKVVAINVKGENSSDIWNFTIDTVPPSEPTLLTPADGTLTDDNTPTLRCSTVYDTSKSETGEASGVRYYEFWVDNDPDFSSSEILENFTISTYTPVTELPGENCSWRVRAWDRAGNVSSFSSVWTFVIENFSVSADPESLEIMRGTKGAVTLSIIKNYGPSENAALSGSWVGGAPDDVTASFAPAENKMPFESTLTFDSGLMASPGTFTYRVKVISDSGMDRTTDIKVTIVSTIFTVEASPSALKLMRSDEATSTVSVNYLLGKKDMVFLSGTWIGTPPIGVATSFFPENGVPSFDSTLKFVTGKNATAGTFTYRVTGKGGGLTRTDDITVNITTNLTLTLNTDKISYEKGQRVNISGSATNPKGDPVKSGTATIRFSCQGWSENLNSTITNGVFSTSYYITFDKPEGTWKITAEAVDNHGNFTPTPENTTITVSLPEAYKHYAISFLSPSTGQAFKRGESITITVEITENGSKVKDVSATLQSPLGEEIALPEIALGIYSATYTLRWNDPLGEWSFIVEGRKIIEDVLKAGVAFTKLMIEPVTLQLELLSPTEREFEVGDVVKVKVKVSYPDGTPVEEGLITARSPNGENLVFTKEGAGIYVSTYPTSSGDIGSWDIYISAGDAYGNSTSVKAATVNIVPMALSSYPIRYWWVTLSIILIIAFASFPAVRGRMLTRRLDAIAKERAGIERLKKEKAIEYFTKGSISRETYDSLIHEYEDRLTRLDKKERMLRRKIKRRHLRKNALLAFTLTLLAVLGLMNTINFGRASAHAEPNLSKAAQTSDFSASANPDNLTLTLSTDRENYKKGQQIRISGAVSGPNEEVVENGIVTIKFSHDDWHRTITADIQEGAYESTYTISFGDPDGTWEIRVDAIDNRGNVGTKSENIYVGLPAATIYYVVEFWAPAKGAIFQRGVAIPISVHVTEAGAGVENASVNCILTSGDNIALTENSPGLYSATYIPPWDSPTGDWCLSVESTKVVDGSFKAGGSYTVIAVEPATLRLDLLSPLPDKREFRPGARIEVKVGLSYSGGAPVDDAMVVMSTPADENLTLVEEDNGIYRTAYPVTPQDIGSWLIQIAAEDPNGNFGSSSFVVHVLPQAHSVSPFLIIGILCVGLGAGVLITYFVRRRMRVERSGAIEEEIKEIRRLQTEAAAKYFKDGTISREVYEALVHEHARRLGELQKEKRKLKEK